MCDENNDFTFIAVSLFRGGPGAAEQVSPGHPALRPDIERDLYRVGGGL